MNKYRITIIAFILLYIPIFFTFANPEIYSISTDINYYSQFLNRDLVKKLIESGEIVKVITDKTSDTTLQYLPDTQFYNSILTDFQEKQPVIGVEVLKYYKPGKMTNFLSEQSILDIYNSLIQISTLKGIKYYSQTRKKQRTLFYDSYVVDSQTKQHRLKDPHLDKPVAEFVFHIFQDDSTFGKNIYNVTYKYSNKIFLIRIQNVTTMKYMFLPLIQPEDMITYMLLIPNKGSILFYGVSYAHFSSFLGLARKNYMSFYYRLLAMYNWFLNKLD